MTQLRELLEFSDRMLRADKKLSLKQTLVESIREYCLARLVDGDQAPNSLVSTPCEAWAECRASIIENSASFWPTSSVVPTTVGGSV